MNRSFWRNSVLENQSNKLKINKEKTNRSSVSKTLCTEFNAEKSVKYNSAVYDRLNRRYRDNALKEGSGNFDSFEGIEETERLYGVIERPCLENYLKDHADDQYVVHTFSRPKKLVALKEKVIREVEVRPMPLSPTVRIGMVGCKLIKPRSISTAFDFRKTLRYRNNFFEAIPRR